jgi:hypothetical protein
LAEILLFDGAEVGAARGASDQGLRIVAFSDAAAARLAKSGITHTRAVDALGDDPEMPLYRAAADWTRGFGVRAKDASGRHLKDALRYRGTTLWWWAELYLHHNTEAARRVRFLETLARVIAQTNASAVRAHGLASDETVLAKRFCAAHTLGFSSTATSGAAVAARGSALTAGLLEASKLVATATKSAGGVDDRLIPGGIVFISHAAFWKSRARADGKRGELRALPRRHARRSETAWPAFSDAGRRPSEHVPDAFDRAALEGAALDRPRSPLRPHQPLRDSGPRRVGPQGLRADGRDSACVWPRRVAARGVLASRRVFRGCLARGSWFHAPSSSTLGRALSPGVRGCVLGSRPAPRVSVCGKLGPRTRRRRSRAGTPREDAGRAARDPVSELLSPTSGPRRTSP